MNDHGQILRELQLSIAEALKRSEERMSHVQRQLAGWTALGPVSQPIADVDAAWEQLKSQADTVTQEVDQELAAAQGSLAELVQQGRQWKTVVTK